MYEHLRQIFTKFEGFRSSPYWDVRQWSWGYGTKVPGSKDDRNVVPTGKITKAQAMIDAFAHVDRDARILFPKLKVELNDKQKAALLSFSYNLGVGNAAKMIEYINDGDKETIEYKWRIYNKVRNDEGVLVESEGLSKRRKFEVDLFNS